MFLFNVRVYGILLSIKGEVLITDEQVGNFAFTKFPGGGLEFGEGIKDALIREFKEECGLKIHVKNHIYTTDFFEKSSFNNSQIISVYYRVETDDEINLQYINEVAAQENSICIGQSKIQKCRFTAVKDFDLNTLTFKTDKEAWKEFERYNSNF